MKLRVSKLRGGIDLLITENKIKFSPVTSKREFEIYCRREGLSVCFLVQTLIAFKPISERVELSQSKNELILKVHIKSAWILSFNSDAKC